MEMRVVRVGRRRKERGKGLERRKEREKGKVGCSSPGFVPC